MRGSWTHSRLKASKQLLHSCQISAALAESGFDVPGLSRLNTFGLSYTPSHTACHSYDYSLLGRGQSLQEGEWRILQIHADIYSSSDCVFSRKASSSAVSLIRSKRPDLERWPAPISHLKQRMLSLVLKSRSLTTNFAGSLHHAMISQYLMSAWHGDHRRKHIFR